MSTIVLGEEQEKAYKFIEEAFDFSDDDYYRTLVGYAGTGKSTLISVFVRDYYRKKRILITAPTHKAVRVLKSMFKELDVEVRTIHSILGIRPKQVDVEILLEDGTRGIIKKEVYEKDKKAPCADFGDYDLLIVDEASMISEDLGIVLDEAIREGNNCRVLFVGDPAQLPPVGEEKSIVFEMEKQIGLTKLHRQAEGNPLIEALTYIRNHLTTPSLDLNTNFSGNSGIILFDDEKSYLKKLYEYFENFHEHPDHARVVCWRNETVRKMNKVIRNFLYRNRSNVPEYVEGDIIMARSPYYVKSQVLDYEVKILENSEEAVIVNRKESVFPYGGVDIDILVLDLKSISFPGDEDEENASLKTITIIREDSKQKFQSMMDALADKAKRERYLWKEFYDIKSKFADIEYAFSLTSHKSQGSTFENVFVLKNDILINPRVTERNQSLYVATSRCKHTAFLL
jgi:exodeoxyribonuclease-5